MGERIVPTEAHVKAHQRAALAGEKLGQPLKDGSPTATAQALARFNLGVHRPIEDTGRVDLANPVFFPEETNAVGKAALAEKLPGALAATKHERTRKTLQKMLDNLPDAVVKDLLPAPDQTPSDTLISELAEKQLRIDPGPDFDPESDSSLETGQKLNSVFLNRKVFKDDPEKAVTVYDGIYQNVVGEQDESGLRLQEIARQMPDRAVLSFDYPGVGGSDPLTAEQKSTKKADSFFCIADARLRIMKKMGIKRINTVGISMGGELAIAMAVRAPKFGIKVDNVVAIGTPGMEHVALPLLVTRDMGEAASLGLHQSSPADPAMWEVKDEPAPSLKETWNNDPYLRYIRMMTKNTVSERARAILAITDAKILFVNGSEDTVSKESTVREVVRQLRSELGEEGKDRVAQVIRPGEGHLAMLHPKLLAPLVKSQLDQTFI